MLACVGMIKSRGPYLCVGELTGPVWGAVLYVSPRVPCIQELFGRANAICARAELSSCRAFVSDRGIEAGALARVSSARYMRTPTGRNGRLDQACVRAVCLL